MRLVSVAGLLFSAVLLVSAAQPKDAPPSADELIQQLTELPKCAITCVTQGLSVSSCELSDFACLCKDDAYTDKTGNCVLSTCSHKGALLTQAWQTRACQTPARDAGPMSRSVNIALIVIAAIFVAIRFLSRWRGQGTNTLGWDDWTILASFLLLIPSTTILQIMTFTGLGRDIWTVPFDDITLMFKYFYFDQYIYQIIIVVTKISIILLYLRIFPKSVSPRFSYVSWGIIAGLLAYCIGFLVYCGFQCRPISYFWKQWDGEHEGYCNNFQLAVYINSGINIFFDLVVFFLPIPKLMQIQVQDKRRKAGVVLTFLVGLFVTACSMVRLKYSSGVSKITNATYDYTDISLWSGIECEVGVICACMPTCIGPILLFFKDNFGSKLSSFTNSKSGGTSNSATLTSRIGGGDSHGVKRLHSTTSEDEHELDDRRAGRDVPKHGGIERTTMYHTSHEQTSRDDVRLVHQGYRNDGKNQWDV